MNKMTYCPVCGQQGKYSHVMGQKQKRRPMYKCKKCNIHYAGPQRAAHESNSHTRITIDPRGVEAYARGRDFANDTSEVTVTFDNQTHEVVDVQPNYLDSNGLDAVIQRAREQLGAKRESGRDSPSDGGPSSFSGRRKTRVRGTRVEYVPHPGCDQTYDGARATLKRASRSRTSGDYDLEVLDGQGKLGVATVYQKDGQMYARGLASRKYYDPNNTTKRLKRPKPLRHLRIPYKSGVQESMDRGVQDDAEHRGLNEKGGPPAHPNAEAVARLYNASVAHADQGAELGFRTQQGTYDWYEWDRDLGGYVFVGSTDELSSRAMEIPVSDV